MENLNITWVDGIQTKIHPCILSEGTSRDVLSGTDVATGEQARVVVKIQTPVGLTRGSQDAPVPKVVDQKAVAPPPSLISDEFSMEPKPSVCPNEADAGDPDSDMDTVMLRKNVWDCAVQAHLSPAQLDEMVAAIGGENIEDALKLLPCGFNHIIQRRARLPFFSKLLQGDFK